MSLWSPPPPSQQQQQPRRISISCRSTPAAGMLSCLQSFCQPGQQALELRPVRRAGTVAAPGNFRRYFGSNGRAGRAAVLVCLQAAAAAARGATRAAF